MSKRHDPFGCHGELTPDLSVRYPEKFGDAPGPIPHCPWRYIREQWDPWLAVVMDIYRDRQQHISPPGWPDAYAASVVEAVRYLEAETRAAEAALWAETG